MEFGAERKTWRIVELDENQRTARAHLHWTTRRPGSSAFPSRTLNGEEAALNGEEAAPGARSSV